MGRLKSSISRSESSRVHPPCAVCTQMFDICDMYSSSPAPQVEVTLPLSTKLGTSAASQGPSWRTQACEALALVCGAHEAQAVRKCCTQTSRTPSASACAMPKCGALRDQSGLKWIVRQIFPPLAGQPAIVRDVTPQATPVACVPHLYILTVLPSSSGILISGDTAGYAAGICAGR